MGEKIEYDDTGYMQGVDEETGKVVWRQKMKPGDEAARDSGEPIRQNLQQYNDEKTSKVNHMVTMPNGKPALMPKGFNPDTMPRTVWPYSKVIAAQICQKLTEGNSLTKIGAMTGFPPTYIIYYWARQHKEFKLDMSVARKDRAEYYADQALDIALSTEEKDDVPAAKLQVDTLKWAAQAGSPDDFAGKPQGNVDGPTTVVIVTGVPRIEDTPITVETERVE